MLKRQLLQAVFWILIIVLVMLPGDGRSIAQTESDDVFPLYFTADGYLYQWDTTSDTPEKLTDEGYVAPLQLSPQGQRLAFHWHLTRDPIMGGYEYGQDYEGGNIYVLEEDGFMRKITISDNYLRSNPVWSGDGKEATWWEGEIVQREEHTYETIAEPRITSFDFHGNYSYQPSTSGAVDAGMAYLPQPQRPAFHITMLQFGAGARIQLYLHSLLTYERTYLPISDWQYAGSPVVVDVWSDAGQQIGLFYPDYGQWDLLNPISYAVEPLENATVEIFSPAAPETSLTWRYDAVDDRWQLLNPAGEILTTFESRFQWTNLTLSPDGQSAAYIADEQLNIWQDSELSSQTIESLESLVWGPMQWRVVEDVEISAYINTEDNADYFDGTDCNPGEWSIGDAARVTGSGGIHLYNLVNPRRGDAGVVPVGTRVTIIDGPLCDDERLNDVWWQIEVYNITGWFGINSQSSFQPLEPIE